MANINSNVITLRTIKQVLMDGTESLNNETRTFNINVRNEKDIILSLETYINMAYGNRDLTILGKVNLSDDGVYIKGLRESGTIYEEELYKLTSQKERIYFDTTGFNYLTISVTLHSIQKVSVSVFSGKIERPKRNVFLANKINKLKVTGQFFRLRAENIHQFTSKLSIKGIDNKGNDVVKTLYSPNGREYSDVIDYSSGVKSDSFVDVSDCEYIVIERTQGDFIFNYSFFNDVEEEYTNFKTEDISGAVRGFDYISFQPNGDYPTMSTQDERGEEVPLYYKDGVYRGVNNMKVLSSDEYVADVRYSEYFSISGGGRSKTVPVFDFEPKKYIKYIEQGDVSIKKLNSPTPAAQYGQCKAWVSHRRGSLEITYTGRDFGNCEYSVPLDDINPNGGGILTAVFIPYDQNPSFSRAISVRLCVQFNDGSIYHNLPNRSTTGQGTVQEGDEARFDKSVIWDYENRFPSMDSNAVSPYYYDPTLPEDNYDPLVPLNESNAYGNGGFPISRNNRTRFRKTDYNQALRSLNGFEIDKIYTACDTYYSTTKNGYLETGDGGREWFLQAPLGAGIPREKSRGVLDTSRVPAFTGSMSLVKRVSNAPSEIDKDPAIKFTLTEVGDVTGVATGLNPNITVPSHGLSVNNKVYFTGSSSSHSFMLNNSHTENSNGNGQVYWVSEVVDANTIKIEPISAYTDTNIECRHVHSINRVHDGWAMACGEEYPNGWIIFIKQELRDFTTKGNPWAKRSITRLTSTKNSVQRAVGFTILDDSNQDPTCLWAVDTSNINMPTLKVGDRETFSRGSNGLRIGKFSDLDDYTKFDTIVEFDDAMLGLKRWMDIIYANGGYGQTFAVSVDAGKTFIKGKWDVSPMALVQGYTENNAILLTNGFIIDRK